jgi:indole-3-glycerol phosphate synthase
MIYPVSISNSRLQPILREIVWQKKLEVAQMQQEMSLASLQRQLTAAPTVRDFFTAVQQSLDKPSLIAEVKPVLPTQGLIKAEFNPVARHMSVVEQLAYLSLLTKSFFREVLSICVLSVIE